MTRCLAPDCQMGGLGGDNMTVVLICFLHNKPYEELIKRCSIKMPTQIVQTSSRRSSLCEPDLK